MNKWFIDINKNNLNPDKYYVSKETVNNAKSEIKSRKYRLSRNILIYVGLLILYLILC